MARRSARCPVSVACFAVRRETPSESGSARILALDPTTYRRHAIHGENRCWLETNCYTDLVIEVLHALGHEPSAALAFTLAIDFELDQWTFFKPPAADLFDLYGIEIQELAVWRPLARHVEEQVAAARPVLVEVDSYYLPDTGGTAYKRSHVKTTIAVNEIDLGRHYLGYFHNQGYYSLQGTDFRALLRLEAAGHDVMLAPYVESMKLGPRSAAPQPAQLVAASVGTLRRHLERAPRANPFARFKQRFAQDLEWLLEGSIEEFHAYAFATLRQYGACYELSETYLRWLALHGIGGLGPAASALREISQGTKALQLQLARAVSRRRSLDLAPLDAMAAHWERAVPALRRQFGISS
jgi:Domain of unknown function (DUF1839)